MSKSFVILFLLSLSAVGSACSSAGSNTNANANAPGVGNVNVDPNKMPEGFSTSPIPPSANTTPGIPDPKAANNIPKGTPTPGIPDPANLRKPFKPGATPTPGIPDPETLRRQMRGNTNVKAPPQVQGDAPMMKKRATPTPQ
jgi:hypothetical protein